MHQGPDDSGAVDRGFPRSAEGGLRRTSERQTKASDPATPRETRPAGVLHRRPVASSGHVPHLFDLRLPSGQFVRGIRLLDESRAAAWARVLRMYPRSRDVTEPLRAGAPDAGRRRGAPYGDGDDPRAREASALPG